MAYLDIILFALIAAFLILRLRSVLGRRDGHQGPVRDPFRPAGRQEAGEDKIIRLPDRSDRPIEGPETEVAGAPPPATGPLAEGMAAIRRADPKFDLNEFLSGARIAFEMVLSAYAAGDRETLKPLLSEEVFHNFEQSIIERERAGEKMEVSLVSLTVEPREAYMVGRTAHVTVKFVSEQISVVRDQNEEVLERSPQTEVTDVWTFARDTRSRNPNWTLVATGSHE